ncbi:hypothetical protein QYF61_003467 [Mycteria americana]|uniref:Uncharacterized protein n=1 Tax=Mycteria americana TaxID=33587 RepID=A0AAN7MXV6_MYCAM|nr:hypothetical protein QYF61_003467 [Mycteria americana]
MGERIRRVKRSLPHACFSAWGLQPSGALSLLSGDGDRLCHREAQAAARNCPVAHLKGACPVSQGSLRHLLLHDGDTLVGSMVKNQRPAGRSEARLGHSELAECQTSDHVLPYGAACFPPEKALCTIIIVCNKRCRSWEGAQPGQLTPTGPRAMPCHMASCLAYELGELAGGQRLLLGDGLGISRCVSPPWSEVLCIQVLLHLNLQKRSGGPEVMERRIPDMQVVNIHLFLSSEMKHACPQQLAPGPSLTGNGAGKPNGINTRNIASTLAVLWFYDPARGHSQLQAEEILFGQMDFLLAPNSKQNTAGVLESVSFNIFIRDLDNETEYTVSIFLVGVKLGERLTQQIAEFQSRGTFKLEEWPTEAS